MSEKRSPSYLIGRVLGIAGLALAIAAVVLLVVGQDPPAGEVDAVESALAGGADTVVPGASDRTTPTSAAPPASSTTTERDGDVEPLATASQRPLSQLVAESVRVPTGLVIESLGVDAPIEAYGIDTRTRQMDIPDNVRDVAWYEYGPSPGQSGSAVLAAHVDLASQGPGVFFRLEELRPGDLVVVSFDDGSEETFEVRARQTYDKDELPLDVVFSRDGPPVLTLITCGGGFSASSNSYDSNVVVYAAPLDAASFDATQS
jgi:sortase (surface protein transpeptidase)